MTPAVESSFHVCAQAAAVQYQAPNQGVTDHQQTACQVLLG